MSSTSSTPEKKRTEKSWVEFISGLWGPSGAEIGIGDDACLLPVGHYAVTSDVLVEGVDFSLGWGPPEAVGHKALACNLSDLAAMGAKPRFFLLSIGFPSSVADSWIERMLFGMHELSSRASVGLCGGDLSGSLGELFISITLLGEQSHPPMTRGGGRPGDTLYVGGALGGPRRALELFRSGSQLREFSAEKPLSKGPERILRRFYEPPSQTELGLCLAEQRLASSCIDCSDGFSSDLSKICDASGCGAEVEAALLPIDSDGVPPAGSGESGIDCALRGGEEQVLIFSVPPECESDLARSGFESHRVGRLTEKECGLILVQPDGRRTPLDARGFNHFDPGF